MVKEFGNNTDDSSEMVLADVRIQAPQVLQAEILEIVAMIVAIPRKILRKIPRRIPRKTLMGLRLGVGCSPYGLDSWDC